MNDILHKMESSPYPPLFVDLDGTLAATDTLWESILLFLKQNPFRIFLLIIWLFKGKEQFKTLLARRVVPDPVLLPYRKEVLAYLQQAHEAGQSLWLATAADQRIADGVAAHLGLFSGVLATNGRGNLAGNRKLQAIREASAGKTFSYIGDAAVDLPVWQAAYKAVMVNPGQGWAAQMPKETGVETIASNPEKGALYNWLKALRVHQWSKNLLLFLPMLMAHRLMEPDLYLTILIAFLSFSFCASAVYILNDLLDIESDRAHPTKQNRPFALGAISIKNGILAIPVLLSTSFLLGYYTLPMLFVYALGLYFITTTLYSVYLKRKVILDAITLGSLYTFRILAGAIAIESYVSSWLLAFSMFFFFSLALIKRYTDLRVSQQRNQSSLGGRGYLIEDIEIVRMAGIASGYLSTLVLAFYINGNHVKSLYGEPALLWLIIPCLLYWITRIWLLTHRGKMIEDPILFAIKDKKSYILGFIVLVILTLASLLTDLSITDTLLLIP